MAHSKEEVEKIIDELKKKNGPESEIERIAMESFSKEFPEQFKKLELQKTISKAFDGIFPKIYGSFEAIKPIIEEATKYHRLWLEELSTKDDEEIRKSIHNSLNYEEILEQEIDKTLSPEDQEKQKELVLSNLEELEEDYFQEVMEIRNKKQELTTEEKKELSKQLNNIQNPKETIFLKNPNVTNLFSLKEGKRPGEQFALANTNISTIRTQDDDGNYFLQEQADFFIQYVFENGLDKGELSLKERLIFHNIIYYMFCFYEINKRVNHGTKKIPTIIPVDTIARMTRGKDTGRIRDDERKLVQKVMKKFNDKRTFIDYEDLKEKYKQRFEMELELDEFELIGTGEFASFVESELHTGINLQEEFAKYGIQIEDDGRTFDGYIIRKIPIFSAIKLQNQLGFLPYTMNSYLSMTETGIAINFEFQNLITSLDRFASQRFTQMKKGSFGTIPISNKGKEISFDEWEKHKKDKDWKKNHFSHFLVYTEETIDTFFEHCFNLISNDKEAERFGTLVDGHFIASGSNKTDNTQRRKRNDQIKRMEQYLVQAKNDGIITDFIFLNDPKSKARQKPIHKVRLYKRKETWKTS